MPYNYYPQSYYNGALPDRLAQMQQQQQGYQPPQIPASMPPQTPIQQPAQSNGMIWVQGEEAAKSYLVAPNNTVILWDSEMPVVYIKSADMSGIPSLRVFDLTERTAQKSAAAYSTPETVEYATKDEFAALSEKVNELLEKERQRQERYEKKKGGAVNNG